MQEQVEVTRWTIPDLAVVALAGFVGSVSAVALSGRGDVALVLAVQFIFTLSALYVVGRTRRRDFQRLAFVVEPRDGFMLVVGAGLQFLIALLFLPLAVLVGLETEPQSLVSDIAGTSGISQRLALLLLVGLAGPILEEIMFRGMLIDALAARFKTKGVIAGSSIAFAVFHLTGVSSSQPLESMVVLVPQLFLFGAVLGYLRITRKRLGPPIFAHAGFNLLSLSVILFYPELL